MLEVFTENINNRVQYTMHLLLKELLGIEYKFVEDRASFCDGEGPKINYGSTPLEDELFFMAVPFLFERKIVPLELEVFNFKNTKAFFRLEESSALPFDIFAASFYLVTRYEEYLCEEKDKHGRFPAEQSLAYQHGFLKQPVINIWAEELRALLLERFPDLPTREHKYSYIPSYDIDIAYSYAGKGLLRNTFGALRSLKNLDFRSFWERISVALGSGHDPFDVYDWLLKLHENYGLKPVFFFLIGDYGQYDKNISIDTPQLQNLIKRIGDYYDLGIHPSYQSNNDPEILAEEVRKLTEVCKKDVLRSRQHYIKLSFPDTYRNLDDNDITKDYTMGYASHTGFRAGIASSFWYYDLKLELPLNLRIYPFAVMDVTLKEYMKLDIKQAKKEIDLLVENIRAVNGLFISIWHNHTLSEREGWEGWKALYEEVVAAAMPQSK